MFRFLLLSLTAVFALGISGCETMNPDGPAQTAMNNAISLEQPGNYFIGRRFYKNEYKMWGWVREPGKSWKTAKLVMFNEQKTLAPDRAGGKLGTDHNYEYRLQGYYSGEQIYEPASNKIYPEFVLTGYELRSTQPALIYSTKRQVEPAVRILLPPTI